MGCYSKRVGNNINTFSRIVEKIIVYLYFGILWKNKRNMNWYEKILRNVDELKKKFGVSLVV